MNRTDRLYALAEQLRTAGAGGRTSGWLAAHFEVSARTIKRDVTALQQAGVPIWATGGPGGGYVLDPAAALPPLTFTAGEAVAIALALQADPDQPYGVDGRSAVTKVLGALTPKRRAEVEQLAGRVWIRSRNRDDDTGAVRRTLSEAVRTQAVVVLGYLSADGRATSKRPVEPLGFAQTRGRWYLMAWCRLRDDGRWFRFDRIAAVWPTTETFEARDVGTVFGAPPDDAHAVRLDLAPPS